MLAIRQLDTSRKLFACFAILLCVSTALALWMLGQMGQLTALTAKTGQKLSAVQASYAGMRIWAGAGIGATVGLGLALAYWLRAEVARPLREAADMARRMAQGDLGTRLDSGAGGDGGALLGSMQDMNDKLAGMVMKVRQGTESMAASAAEIAAGSRDLALRSGEQAAALVDAASALGRLGASAGQHAARAHEAGLLAQAVSDVAARGGAAVAEVAGRIASIDACARRIGDISGVIDGIAFQTNVLALNAAVEAARAGEQGHSFAVLAAEVRSLAQRAAAAAREITLLTGACVQQAGAGAELASRAGATMDEVAASVQRVGGSIGEIAGASAAQSAGIEQVNRAILAMDQAARHNAALAERGAAAAASMRDQAGGLSRTSAAFSLGRNHALSGPGLRLVSSNPHALVRIHADGKPRARATPVMRAVLAQPPAAGVPKAGARRRGSAVRDDLDW